MYGVYVVASVTVGVGVAVILGVVLGVAVVLLTAFFISAWAADIAALILTCVKGLFDITPEITLVISFC